MRRSRLVAGTLLALAAAAGPAAAHHTGVYTPRDNAITASFKQIKFSVEARKFDVARRMFTEGPLRAEMAARAASLPDGLEARTRAALERADAAETERALMIFFCALGRDLAREADRQLATGAPAGATANRFLEAIWRYYNLVDFVVGRHQARASVAMRLAYDDAETLARSAATAPAAVSGPRVRESFRRIAAILAEVVEGAAPAR